MLCVCVLLILCDGVVLPDCIDHEVAACCVGDGVRAYIALQYLGRVSFGDTVLIMDAATPFGTLAIQLAHAWGAKVRYLPCVARLCVLWMILECQTKI